LNPLDLMALSSSSSPWNLQEFVKLLLYYQNITKGEP